MRIESFPILMSEEEARRKASRKASFPASLWLGKSPLTEIRRIFIEHRLLTFAVTIHPGLIERVFKKNPAPRSTKIRIIANGSTCGVSYYDDRGLSLEGIDVEEDEVQLSDYPDNVLTARGNALARRILHRRVGGNMSLEVLEIKSVFRPYFVAFFGKIEEGAKVRYLPMAADGNTVKRTF